MQLNILYEQIPKGEFPVELKEVSALLLPHLIENQHGCSWLWLEPGMQGLH